MIDITIIKENYARMADEQLIDLIKKDGHAITYEAFIVLKREFVKRNLDPEIVREAEELRLEGSKNKILTNFKREDQIVNQVLWNLVFRLKAEKKTDQEIIDALKQKEVPTALATEAVTKIETYARLGLKKLQKAILLSIVLLMTGIIISVVAFSDPVNLAYLFVCTGMLIISTIKYLPGHHRAYQLFVRAITVIEEEKTEKSLQNEVKARTSDRG